MNAAHIMKELELAAWECAEAETYEVRAKVLREQAFKRTAAVHFQIKSATELVIELREKSKK